MIKWPFSILAGLANLRNLRFLLVGLVIVGATVSSTTTTASTHLQKNTHMDTPIIDFDALKKANWSDQEVQNATVIVDFVQHLMNNHDFDYILEKYGDNPYVQHNRNIPDGIAGLVDFVGKFAKRYPEYAYDVKHILVDGEYVTFHSHATVKQAHRGDEQMGLNIKDTWRVVNGQVVEHWDAIQAINSSMRFFVWLSGGAVRNANGIF